MQTQILDSYLRMWDAVLRELQTAEVIFDEFFTDKALPLIIGLSWYGLL